jgi:hypothetical protein
MSAPNLNTKWRTEQMLTYWLPKGHDGVLDSLQLRLHTAKG